MITIQRTAGFSDSEATLIAQAVSLVNQALASLDFQARVLKGNFTEMHGCSNAEALAKLKVPAAITFRGYRAWIWSKVMGYFTSGDDIWINRRKMPGMTPITLASLILHEFSHRQGFTHNGTWATSLPYSLNRVFEEWATHPGLLAAAKAMAVCYEPAAALT